MIARRLIVALVAMVPTLFALQADAGDEMRDGAKKFVKGLADQALDILKDNIPKTERDVRFRRIFDDGFDVRAIGAFCLGKSWSKASPEERARYLELFQEFIVQTYSARLDAVYNGETFVLDKVRANGDDGAIVGSKFVPTSPGSTPVRIDWRVRRTGGDYRIIDVFVEGVSMALTQRDEFASVIQRQGGLKGLFAALEEKIGKLQSGAE